MSRPRDWYDMTYDQQREWERNECRHADDLATERGERERLEEACDAERRQHHRTRAAAQHDYRSVVDECGRLQELLNEAKTVLTELVEARPEAVQMVNRQTASFPASIALAAEHAKAVLAKLQKED